MNERQKELYRNGTYQNVMSEKKSRYNDGTLYNEDTATQYGKEINIEAFTCASSEDVAECLKMRDNRKSRMKNLSNRITYWRAWRDRTTELYFVTFTLNNESLQSMTTDTHKKYITRVLKQFCLDYIGNIDYGKKNGRPHFHFIIVVSIGTNPLEELEDLKKYGWVQVERWRPTKKRNEADALKATVNYTDKLAMHALKDENDAPLITMRNTDYHRYKQLAEELGPRRQWVNSFPELRDKAIEFAELTDHPWWIRHNSIYGVMTHKHTYASRESGPSLFDNIEDLGNLFGEDYEIDYGDKIVTLGGKITRKDVEQ